ncbi:MAG: FAD:protein FMN transferase [Candidatus Azambacteria bacterium]|nr:FAD:protein FMN transferase [Candidatus Azambacteria bacterium]
MNLNPLTPWPGNDHITTEKKFRAMGTDVVASIVSSDSASACAATEDVARMIDAFEKRFSRFLSSSELCVLNKTSGDVCHMSAEMIDMLEVAQQWHKETGGIFDPTICEALERVGYNKSFDVASAASQTKESEEFDGDAHHQRFLVCPRFSDLRIHKEAGSVTMPHGMKLDFGGIGKGYIIDVVARMLSYTYHNFWVSAGGDMFLSGCDSDAKPWEIMVQDPFNFEHDIGYLVMAGKKEIAVATSGIMKRKGEKEGVAWHHIIDPHTRLPAANTIVAVTVIAPTVTTADVCAKTILILGEQKGIDFIEQQEGCACLIIKKDRSLAFSRAMEEHFIAYP